MTNRPAMIRTQTTTETNNKFLSCRLSFTIILSFVIILLVCVPSAWQKPRLIFANKKDIRLLDFRGTIRGNTSIIIRNLTEATALDIHYRLGLLCWSDIDQERIQCGHLPDHLYSNSSDSRAYHANPKEEKKTIVSSALHAPEDLVCDFVTSKLYFSSSENSGSRIEVGSLFKPYYRKVLVWEDIDQQRALALAPHLGIMFFTDWGEYPKIERVGMDGTERKTIVEREIFWPNGLSVDLNSQTLYWVDAKLHYIARVDFNGNQRKTIISQDQTGAPQHPFALAFYNNTLFWTDWHTNSIHFVKTDEQKNPRTINTKQNLTPMDLVIFEEQTIPNVVNGEHYAFTNPCETAPCSHLCLLSPRLQYSSQANTSKHYTCTCPIGHMLYPGSSTKCLDEIQSFLLAARGHDIRRISLDTPDYTDVVLPLSGIKHILAVDYHVKTGFLFWTDDEARRIRRAKLDGSSQEDVVKDEIVHPDGLVVDWVAENLYWTDAGTDRIEVSRLNGEHRKIVISRGLQEPRAISVDPKRGFLFWSDWGKKAKIERSFMDGSSRTIIIREDVMWPNGIALDILTERIFWTDAGTDKIEVARYDGSAREELLSEDLPHIFGFSLLGDYIYWTDWQTRKIERASKNRRGDRVVIKDPFNDPMGLKAIWINDPILNITNACSIKNGGCQHLCLYRPSGHVCACASGYELEQDNHSCRVPDAFLVFSRDGDLHRISLNRSNHDNHDDVIPVSKVKQANAVDFDTVENRIYWSDTKIKTISRAFMNGSDTSIVIEYGLIHPEGIAVDWLSRNIYWSDMGRNQIEVAKLNGAHRRTILWNDIDAPKSITLHPSRGWMYFALWRIGGPTVERAALDGSRRTIFLKPQGRVNGLTIDLEESYIYWTDIDSATIERAALDDPQRRREIVVHANGISKPFSLAQYQDYIYYSDLASQTILRANKSVPSTSSSTTTSLSSPEKLTTAINIMDMAIYHKLKQVGWNPCSQANCSHLCFPIPIERENPRRVQQITNSQCGCPTHYTLSDDGTTCTEPRQFLLLSSSTTINRLLFNTNECPEAVVIGGQKKIGALAWDNQERVIYWIDNKTANIKRATENGSSMSYLLNPSKEVFRPFDLAFDSLRRILFWTCENYNSINISDTSGKSLGAVISGSNSNGDYVIMRPRYLALNPQKAQIYFSDEGKIVRVRIDGMDHVTIVTGGAIISGITIDLIEKMLFWIDAGLKTIETCDLDGSNRKVLVSGLDSPNSIAVMRHHVYWIDEYGGGERSSGVEMADKWTGENRNRVLPRITNANYILNINDTFISDMIQNHPCHKLQCPHICLETECSCPDGYVLEKDRRTCGLRLPCGAHEFSCTRGHIGCIPLQLKCNQKSDCTDNSDEEFCEPRPPCEIKCPCEGGCLQPKCIKKENLCNGIVDCIGSNWDESESACAV